MSLIRLGQHKGEQYNTVDLTKVIYRFLLAWNDLFNVHLIKPKDI